MPPMNEIRLVVSDIDGTLVRHDKSLPDANIAAACRLAEAGIPMALISARPRSGMAWIAEALGIDGPCGAFNGGSLFDRHGVIGTPQRLGAHLGLRILRLLDDAGVDVWVFADGLWYARNDTNAHVPREKLSAGLSPTLRDDLAAVCTAADKIVGVSDDAALLQRVQAEVLRAAQGEATVALSQPYFLDATALLANKGDGVAALASAMGVPLSEVAVIGDMPNDLPMFARAGLAVAMGQAPQAVRDAAQWTTRSNEEDGVAWAIDRILANGT
ncbi:hydrolase Cof [Rhodoferax koreense]|uniref:Hydrolase Cof n=1 Tax=Rhodoferax koreensis TaxID=1842727 RepID=A0A1P8K1X6_9BURK|nr:Cof-type HAD-IIB family hydrolase [Rhodoferax koreense]APW39997.1 hydrolase Cof [Rhodoferax koreense]